MSGKTNPSSTAPSPHQAVLAFSDASDLATKPTRAIIVGEAGAIKYDDAEGNTITFTFPAGIFPISMRKIHATGTAVTAGTVLGLY